MGVAGSGDIDWPAGHEPAGADLDVRNETTTTASPDAVWRWLERPDQWHRFYRNAWRPRPVAGSWPRLTRGSEFRWITFGAPVTTVVTEYAPPYALAWTGHGLGAVGHHAWRLVPRGDGCRIVTEETQRGRAVRLLAPVLRPAMVRLHQSWVEGLARIAEESE